MYMISERSQGVFVGLLGMREGGERRVELPALTGKDWDDIQGIPANTGYIVG